MLAGPNCFWLWCCPFTHPALDAVWTLQSFMPAGHIPRKEQMVTVREALYHKMKVGLQGVGINRFG